MQESVKDKGIADPCGRNPCPEEALCLRSGISTFSCKCREGFREVDGVCEEVGAEARAGNCSELDCHRGRCEEDSDGNNARCVCDNPMFAGEFCDEYACAGHCLNGGMCFPHWDEAAVEQGLKGSPPPPKLWCVCPQNFTGARCEVAPAGCTCENGGKCALVGGADKRLQCRCPEGFAGERCEECEGSPGLCQNGGVCVKDALGQPMCRCAPGYNGEACQYTPCSACRNGGTCSLDADGGNPVCDCTLQFTGPTCEEFTCDNFCLNGGAPSFLSGGAGGCGCECRPGTGGDRCEMAGCSGETASKCQNGGSCVLVDETEVCNCTARFAGDHCEMDVSVKRPCEDWICHNGGVCHLVETNKGPQPRCICPMHRTGLFCDRPNICLDHCLNGGTCQVLTYLLHTYLLLTYLLLTYLLLIYLLLTYFYLPVHALRQRGGGRHVVPLPALLRGRPLRAPPRPL